MLFRKRYTQDDLVADLKNLGIGNGDVVLVHSSLSRIGYVQGGAETVIESLIEAVGENGTIVMPAFTVCRSMKETLKWFVFVPNYSRTNVGLIPETFRKHRDVYRSIHPTHSICAYGKLGKQITQGHEDCQTTFGVGTPLYKLLTINAKILGLAVDLSPITFYHVIEEVEDDFPLKVHYEDRIDVDILDNDGNAIKMNVLAYNPLVADTRIEKNPWIRNYFTEYLRSKGYLHEGQVGRSHSWFVFTKNLYEIQLELAKKGITIYTTKEEMEGNQ